METSLRDRLVKTLDVMDICTAGKIAELCGLKFPETQKYLRELIRQGLAQKTTDGMYLLTGTGRALADKLINRATIAYE